MKKNRNVILLLAVLCFSPILTAQELKIGFIDLPALIEISPQATAATKRLLEQFKPRQNSIASDAKRYHSLVLKLEKDALILNEQQKLEFKAEIQKLERQIKRDEQEFREDLNIQKNNEFKKTRDIILKVIAKLAEQDKYDLIITEGALYASERINISKKVLDMLKAESKQVESTKK